MWKPWLAQASRMTLYLKPLPFSLEPMANDASLGKQGWKWLTLT